MYVEYNNVERSRNVYTSSAILTAWNHFTRRWRFYGDLMSPATIKHTSVFWYSARHLPVLMVKCPTFALL